MRASKNNKFKTGNEWASSFIREKTMNKLWSVFKMLETQNFASKLKEK